MTASPILTHAFWRARLGQRVVLRRATPASAGASLGVQSVPFQQGGAAAARLAHNQKVGGANPPPASNSSASSGGRASAGSWPGGTASVAVRVRPAPFIILIVEVFMSASVITATGKANRVAEESFGKHRRMFRSVPLLTEARRLWPRKTAAEIAARTSATPRTAENWLARVHDMPASAVMDLLRSDRGADFLDVIVQAMPPKQWAAFRRKIRDEVRRELLADLARQRDEIDSI